VRYPESFLTDLRSQLRLPTSSGVRCSCAVRGGEYVGLSPFAREKTPSFFVHDEKGFFHDVSSGRP